MRWLQLAGKKLCYMMCVACAGGSNLRETPHGGSQAGDPSGGASGMGFGGSRTVSVGSARLQLPGVAATRVQASLHAEVLNVRAYYCHAIHSMTEA